MKRRIKGIKCLIFLVMLSCIGAFAAGCGEKKETKDTPQEVGKRFLEQVFTSDYEERYTEFLEDGDIEKYYKTFYEYASQECIEGLKQNRIPAKYDKEAKEEKEFYTVSEIDLKFDETGTGTFEVLLVDKKNKDEVVQKATGQITVDDKKVNSFFLSNIVPCEK